jgi:MFS family permease
MLGLIAALMLAPVTMPVPVLRGLVAERFAVGDFQTSLFMSVNMIGALLTAPLAGALADRIGRQKMLIAAALGADAACLAALTAPVPFWVFLAIRFAEGCAHIAALSLLLSLAGELARHAGRGRTLGAVGSGITLGVALGAPLGGWLGRGDHFLPLRAGALVLLALAGLVAICLRDAPRTAQRPSWRQIAALARAETALLVPLAFAFVDRFTVGFFTTTFTLYLRRVHELPVAEVGLLLGLFLGPFSLLSWPFARLSERTSRCALVAGGSLAYGLGVITLGAWSPGALPALMLLLGVLSAVMFVPSLLLLTDLAPGAIRSTALGAFNAAGSLGFVLGPLVGGAVSQLVGEATTWQRGYAAAFAVAGAAEIGCVLVTWPALRRLVRAGRTA